MATTSNQQWNDRPLKILVVDDDELFLDYITWELEALSCSVAAATDATQALALLDVQTFDMFITDWQMPGMDGIALVQRVRSLHSQDRFLHVVMTTARGDSETVRAALDAGVDDFLFKPLDRLQLELAMASARRNVLLHHRLQRRNHHLAAAHRRTRDAYRRVQADLDAAAALHRRLLPERNVSDGLRLAWAYRPAQHISGDTIGVLPLRNGARLFFLADVQGHGVPAALASFHIHHRLTQLAPDSPDAMVRAIVDLNREIASQNSESYATLICGLLFPHSREGWIIRAGHPPPLLVQPGRIEALAVPGAFPLGWFTDAEYEPSHFVLPPNARLVLYSDGVTECSDRDGNALEMEGLCDLLAVAVNEPIATMVRTVEAALSARRGRSGFEDDISLLALEMIEGVKTGDSD
ncbi:PP2C family protein-serine/threonine phosphatase [Sphingobium sp. RAC03]|uniref:PP2C family protein-serine/threonine phosphatase n=1 Tax=Sphingobium sp. RAC03 TaxID=1843368 RepID=UPI00085844D7|nr:SpoIIE family protein phosphatase [Sphingobium sp. RAC03]AOF95114.1 stage II sporulation E family protein [Sphingobium sp. RAC03]